jgi:hypothetical protein
MFCAEPKKLNMLPKEHRQKESQQIIGGGSQTGTEREREREAHFPTLFTPRIKSRAVGPSPCPPGIIDKTDGSFQNTLMYCKEPGVRKLKDRRVNTRSASPSFSPGQKLSPFSLSAKKTKKKPLLAPCLPSTLSLSLSRVVSPFLLDL